MNRLILIGNGFDLAHGLKTSYADFIEWYWNEWNTRLKKSFNRIEEDTLCSFELKDSVKMSGWYNIWEFQLGLPILFDNDYDVLTIAKQNNKLCDFVIKSPLFNKICYQVETKKWVDIEDVYYYFLKSSDNPKQINDDLEFLKNKLIEYLKSLQEATVNPKIQKQILEHFNKEDVAIGSMNHWYNMIKERINYTDEKWDSIIDGHIINREIPEYDLGHIHRLKQFLISEIERVGVDKVDESVIHKTFFLPDNIMLLNFNYTNTADMYLPKADKFTINHIHGSLSKPESVIFGYGDERDDEYDVLMKKNDDEYLQHIKSFRYLEASNYRDMLSFIESAPYQLCIMGHSCGLSDRTLLATLFEHRNCVSIKPYYYKRKDGTDNYRELVQNIARNFKDPTLMRDRVVRKDRCEPLG